VCRQMLLSKCTQTKERGSCVWTDAPKQVHANKGEGFLCVDRCS